MPHACEPWPEKRKATAPSSFTSCVPAPGTGRPAARASRPSSSPSRSSASTTARRSRAARVVAAACATSSRPGPGCSRRWVPSRAAWARSAGPVRADTTTGTGPGSARRGSRGAPSPGPAVPRAASGDSSTITWALVPLMPKAETAARRGRPGSSQSRACASRATVPADQSTCGEGRSTCRVRGSRACRSAITVLMSPATPAAAWVCPRLDLTEPSQSGRSALRCLPYAAISACASMGSPRVVPVPCPSTASTSAGVSPAPASA